MVYSTARTSLWYLVGFAQFFFSILTNFIRRFGSSGIFGLGLPFVIEKMLKQYGYAVTLRIYAIAIVCII
jgi:hypothetical protein